MDEKLTPPVQGDATLEKVTGGSSQEVTTFLYRCPKCGREGRHNVQGLSPKLKCIFCMVNMEIVDGSEQWVTAP